MNTPSDMMSLKLQCQVNTDRPAPVFQASEVGSGGRPETDFRKVAGQKAMTPLVRHLQSIEILTIEKLPREDPSKKDRAPLRSGTFSSFIGRDPCLLIKLSHN